jgi:hypothetical protein
VHSQFPARFFNGNKGCPMDLYSPLQTYEPGQQAYKDQYHVVCGLSDGMIVHQTRNQSNERHCSNGEETRSPKIGPPHCKDYRPRQNSNMRTFPHRVTLFGYIERRNNFSHPVFFHNSVVSGFALLDCNPVALLLSVGAKFARLSVPMLLPRPQLATKSSVLTPEHPTTNRSN